MIFSATVRVCLFVWRNFPDLYHPSEVEIPLNGSRFRPSQISLSNKSENEIRSNKGFR